MRLDIRAFGTAAGIVAAVLFTICALAVAAAPAATTAFAGYLVHMDLSGMTRPITLASFVGGLVVWALGTGAAFAGAAAIYNRLIAPARAARAITGHPAAQHG